MPPTHAKSNDLAASMYASVCTPRPYDACLLPCHSAQGFFQNTLNTALACLNLEAMIICAVVFNHCPQVTKIRLINVTALARNSHLLDQLDKHHGRIIALTTTQLEDTGIPPPAILIARCNLVK